MFHLAPCSGESKKKFTVTASYPIICFEGLANHQMMWNKLDMGRAAVAAVAVAAVVVVHPFSFVRARHSLRSTQS